MDIVKISMLGIAGVLFGFMLKGTRPEYAFYVSFGVGILILMAAVSRLEYLYDSLKKMQDALPIDSSYMTAILKMLGISYIGHLPLESARMPDMETSEIRLNCLESLLL